MRMFLFYLVDIYLIFFIRHGRGISTGAPPMACTTMTPGHGPQPQPGQPPVKVTVDKNTIAPGEILNIRIESVNGQVFKGTLIQVRKDEGDPGIEGSFQSAENAQIVDCPGRNGGQNAVTHFAPIPKTFVEATWIAPSDLEGKFTVRFSVVVNFVTFWANHQGPEITVTLGGGIKEESAPTNETIKTTTTTKMPKIIIPATTTTPAPAYDKFVESSHPSYASCGETKSCFGIPNKCIGKKKCFVIGSYRPLESGQYIFEIAGVSDGYVALGLSFDSNMDHDLTTACIIDQGTSKVFVQTGLNVDKSNRVPKPLDYGILAYNGSFNDGVLSCVYTRPAVVKVPGFNDATFRLNSDKFVVLMSEGAYLYKLMMKHRSKDKSSEPHLLEEIHILQGHSKLFIKMHGSIMILAWVGSASLGILLARYFRETFTSTAAGGMSHWFFWHRNLMCTTWCLTLFSFCIIFYELEGIADISIQEDSHAFLGCFTTTLSFIQPFMAMLRPHPKHEYRFIFNKFHFYVGNAAYYMGLTAIFFSVELDKAALPGETTWLLMTFMGVHFTIHSVLMVPLFAKQRLPDRFRPKKRKEKKKKTQPPPLDPKSLFSITQNALFMSKGGKVPMGSTIIGLGTNQSKNPLPQIEPKIPDSLKKAKVYRPEVVNRWKMASSETINQHQPDPPPKYESIHVPPHKTVTQGSKWSKVKKEMVLKENKSINETPILPLRAQRYQQQDVIKQWKWSSGIQEKGYIDETVTKSKKRLPKQKEEERICCSWFPSLPDETIQKICLPMYMFTNTMVTFILMSLVIMAPTRDSLVSWGILPKLSE